MKLSKTSALAALAMAYLANQPGNAVVQARQVADHLSIPTDSALKILQTLARHKLIDSRLGRGGGYRLTKMAENVSLLEIVEAIDGPIDAQMPLTSDENPQASGLEVLESVCELMVQHVRDELSAATVAQLVPIDRAAVLAAVN